MVIFIKRRNDDIRSAKRESPTIESVLKQSGFEGMAIKSKSSEVGIGIVVRGVRENIGADIKIITAGNGNRFVGARGQNIRSWVGA